MYAFGSLRQLSGPKITQNTEAGIPRLRKIRPESMLTMRVTTVLRKVSCLSRTCLGAQTRRGMSREAAGIQQPVCLNVQDMPALLFTLTQMVRRIIRYPTFLKTCIAFLTLTHSFSFLWSTKSLMSSRIQPAGTACCVYSLSGR